MEDEELYYQQKYIKYKNRYLQLKHEMYGGTKSDVLKSTLQSTKKLAEIMGTNILPRAIILSQKQQLEKLRNFTNNSKVITALNYIKKGQNADFEINCQLLEKVLIGNAHICKKNTLFVPMSFDTPFCGISIGEKSASKIATKFKKEAQEKAVDILKQSLNAGIDMLDQQTKIIQKGGNFDYQIKKIIKHVNSFWSQKIIPEQMIQDILEQYQYDIIIKYMSQGDITLTNQKPSLVNVILL